jgi:hypothetical protein
LRTQSGFSMVSVLSIFLYALVAEETRSSEDTEMRRNIET